MTHSIIVHGGAWDIPEESREPHRRGCLEAARLGNSVLERGGSALDAIQAAVMAMEADDTFDAGFGSVLNADADIEMDAMVMEGAQLRIGSVAAVQAVRHPIVLARKVMELSPHCMIVGEGALRFARSIGMETVTVKDLLTAREFERWKEIRADRRYQVRRLFEGEHGGRGRDTVGAVALDSSGLIAAATSTGGVPGKLSGRVGDSPIVGCGAYADNESAGASATGWGEYLLRTVPSKRVCDGISNGLHPAEATSEAIRHLARRVNGLGGMIAVDRKGRIGYAFNTPHMACAYIDAEGRNDAFV